MSKSRIMGLGIGVLAIMAAFGLVMWQTANMPTSNTAFAQGATATPTAVPATGTAPSTAPQQTQTQIGDTFWTLLAGKLGINADELKTKAVEARKEMIDEAVASDRITPEQADIIKGRIDANGIIAPIQIGRADRGPGNMPGNQPYNQQQPQGGPFDGFGHGMPGHGFGGGFGGMMGRGMGANLETLNAVATALKLEPQALVTQLSQGKSLADIAKAQGVDESVVKQAIIDHMTAQIDEQLKLGLISQVQANQLKANLKPENIDLSRGFRFHFNMTKPNNESSGLFPAIEWGQAFGFMPDDETLPFGNVFGTAPDGSLFSIPFGNIQTQ